MHDKELLEFAAKAAGIDVHTIEDADGVVHWDGWNPLIDDGDALRLAVKLNIDVWFDEDCFIVGTTFMAGKDGYNTEEHWTEIDKFVATRLAIVRAAAEIGIGKYL